MKIEVAPDSALAKTKIYGTQKIHRLRPLNLLQWLRSEQIERGQLEKFGPKEEFLIKKGRAEVLDEVLQLAKAEEKLKEKW